MAVKFVGASGVWVVVVPPELELDNSYVPLSPHTPLLAQSGPGNTLYVWLSYDRFWE